jgi:hypothetical protein
MLSVRSTFDGECDLSQADKARGLILNKIGWFPRYGEFPGSTTAPFAYHAIKVVPTSSWVQGATHSYESDRGDYGSWHGGWPVATTQELCTGQGAGDKVKTIDCRQIGYPNVGR